MITSRSLDAFNHLYFNLFQSMTTAFNIEVVFKSKLKSTLVVFIKYVNVYMLNAQFHHMNEHQQMSK